MQRIVVHRCSNQVETNTNIYHALVYFDVLKTDCNVHSIHEIFPKIFKNYIFCMFYGKLKLIVNFKIERAKPKIFIYRL